MYKNSGDTFSEELLKQGYNRDSIINLEIHKEYVVYGMSLLNGELDYLILGKMKTCLHGTQVNCLKCRILYNL